MKLKKIARGAALWLWAAALVLGLGLRPGAAAVSAGDVEDDTAPGFTAAYHARDTRYLARRFQGKDSRISGAPAPEESGSTLNQEMSPAARDMELPENERTAKKEEETVEAKTVSSQAPEITQKHLDDQKNDRNAYYIRVNRSQNTVTVYERDESGAYTVPIKAMVCSTGLATPLGTYRTSDKYEWRELFGRVYGQYATRITGHILFHSVPYTSMRKNTLKYAEYNKLGTTASMGCVRLCVADVKWIYDYCAAGTRVNIYDDDDPGPLGKPAPIAIDEKDERRGWDPTDPDPDNPWKK